MNLSEQQIQTVWEQAEAVRSANPTKWRKDACGAWICRDQFGNRNSEFGWEINCIRPVDNGGTEVLSDLRPLQWINNEASRSGNLLCRVKANGGVNIDFSKMC
jgi:hypothetical protein